MTHRPVRGLRVATAQGPQTVQHHPHFQILRASPEQVGVALTEGLVPLLVEGIQGKLLPGPGDVFYIAVEEVALLSWKRGIMQSPETT